MLLEEREAQKVPNECGVVFTRPHQRPGRKHPGTGF